MKIHVTQTAYRDGIDAARGMLPIVASFAGVDATMLESAADRLSAATASVSLSIDGEIVGTILIVSDDNAEVSRVHHVDGRADE